MAGSPNEVKTVDIEDEEDWKQPPVVSEPSFDQRVSFWIAALVLGLFSGIYLLSFIVVFCMMRQADATFDKGVDVVKFMISSILPVVTLAVGYYLGERTSSGDT